MAIIDPVSIPNQDFSSITFRPFSAVGVARSPFTLHTQAQPHIGEVWAVDINYPPMKRPEAEEIITFLLSLNGRELTFLVGDPNGGTPRGVGTGTPLVKGAGQTGKVLLIDGATITTTDWLKKGDWFQIGTGLNTRLHKQLKDVDSDGGGDVSLDIWPALRESPADNAPLILTNTVGRFRLIENEMPFDIGRGQFYGISFSGMEVI